MDSTSHRVVAVREANCKTCGFANDCVLRITSGGLDSQFRLVFGNALCVCSVWGCMLECKRVPMYLMECRGRIRKRYFDAFHLSFISKRSSERSTNE